MCPKNVFKVEKMDYIYLLHIVEFQEINSEKSLIISEMYFRRIWGTLSISS